MRVLVPIPFDLAPLTHGRNLRIVHLLRELNNVCDLTCIAAEASVAERASILLDGVPVEAADPCPGDTASLHRLERAIAFFGSHPGLSREVAKRGGDVDAVLGFGLPSVSCLAAARGCTPRPRIVCDLIDDPILTWRSLLASRRYSLAGLKGRVAYRLIRRRVLGAFDQLVVVGPRDADALSRATGAPVAIVPNGVDVEDLPATHESREPLVVFTGAMDFPPNAEAACFIVNRVWPIVLRAMGTSRPPRLAIVGARPSANVRRLAEVPGVSVTGAVESLRPWLERARAAAAPMVSGSGIKNKVLEACAAGCPVVATARGAEGLPTGPESGILVADRPADFARHVAGLLDNAAFAARIGAAGHAMVRGRFRWSEMAGRLFSILEDTKDRAIERRRDGETPIDCGLRMADHGFDTGPSIRNPQFAIRN